MCDILHMRHTHLWLKPDFIFNFTKYAKEQVGLLDLIHGLTNNVSIDIFFGNNDKPNELYI
jgi:cytochrome P450 family 4